MFFGLPDPSLLGMNPEVDPNPDPSINSKKARKTSISIILASF